MLSLLITTLLGFFCCSSVAYTPLDHTKEIELKEEQPKYISYDGHGTTYVTQTEFLHYYPAWVQFFINVWNADNPFVYGYSYSSQTQAWSQNISFNQWKYIFYLEQIEDLYNNRDIKYQCLSGEFIATRNANEFFQTKRIRLTFGLSDGTTFERNFLYHIYDRSDNINTLTDGDLVGAIYYFYNNGSTYAEIMNECLVFPQNTDMANIIAQQLSTDYDNGYNNGYQDGYNTAYQTGYNAGIDYASQLDSTALTIFTGFIDVGLLPINVFLQILNFEVFGINIAGFVSALLTISLVVIIIRIVVGSKND